MKNVLVSRDPICIFSENFGALVDKNIYTRAQHKLRIILVEYEQLQRLLFCSVFNCRLGIVIK